MRFNLIANGKDESAESEAMTVNLVEQYNEVLAERDTALARVRELEAVLREFVMIDSTFAAGHAFAATCDAARKLLVGMCLECASPKSPEDRIAQLEAELKAARERLNSYRLGELVWHDGKDWRVDTLRERLALAEAVCEAGSACERDEWDVVETVDAYYKALAAWRKAKEGK